MVDIQSATAEIRQGKKIEDRKKKKPQNRNIMACPITYAGYRKLNLTQINCNTQETHNRKAQSN